MSYWKALGYLGAVIRIGNAIAVYKQNKKEGQLTSELLAVIYDSVARQNPVDRIKVLEAAKALAEVVKDVVK